MTSSTIGLFNALLAVLWPVFVGIALARQLNKSRQAGWLVVLMGMLILIGGEGFFAPSLIVNGVIKPSNSFQWPAGYVNGIVRTPDGGYVVPLKSLARVQVYDPHWRFIRGWQVGTFGKEFRVECTPQGIIDVFSANGLPLSSFTEDGARMSADRSGRSSADYLSMPPPESIMAPTSPLLLAFSSPSLCWVLMVVGVLGLVIVDRLAKRGYRQLRG
jgi:hypothetical protein